jgi:hypothetical protein
MVQLAFVVRCACDEPPAAAAPSGEAETIASYPERIRKISND